MAKTNAKGYFCDFPCGMMNSRCQNFFRAGCATAGIPLKANTEYPEYKRVHVEETAGKEQEKSAKEK